MSLISFYSSRSHINLNIPNINSIKSLQRNAAGFVLNDYRYSPSCSEFYARGFKLAFLRECCTVNDLTMFYKKIIH